MDSFINSVPFVLLIYALHINIVINGAVEGYCLLQDLRPGLTHVRTNFRFCINKWNFSGFLGQAFRFISNLSWEVNLLWVVQPCMNKWSRSLLLKDIEKCLLGEKSRINFEIAKYELRKNIIFNNNTSSY